MYINIGYFCFLHFSGVSWNMCSLLGQRIAIIEILVVYAIVGGFGEPVPLFCVTCG